MTTEITETPAETGVSLQRQSYMAALSLAEQLMSETSQLPTDFEVKASASAPGSPELRFYFHRNAAALRQFRDDQMLTETMDRRKDGSVCIEATREDVRGVRVVAWTLYPADVATEAVSA